MDVYIVKCTDKIKNNVGENGSPVQRRNYRVKGRNSVSRNNLRSDTTC